VLLFAAFGSLLMPVKAIPLNLLSLTATFGAMVYDRTGDNAGAIATGLGRTGGLITAAALLLAISFAAFG
jgi:RND superfamily putative drug exporter